MNRSEMKAVLDSGGTLLYHGRHIQKHAELPSEAELALDNGNEDDALKSLNVQAAKLAADKEALEKAIAEKKAAKLAAKEAKAEAKDEAKVVKAGPEKLAEVVHEKDDKGKK